MGLGSEPRALSLTELFGQVKREFTARRPFEGGGFQPMAFVQPGFADDAVDPAVEAAREHAAELDAARADAFAAGLDAGRAENIEAVEMIVGECRALIQSLEDARAVDRAALGPMLKNAVLDLVTQIVEAHVAADPAFVNGCVGRALSTIKEAHEAARLYLHPDDIANIGEDATAGFQNLSIAADPALTRGSVRLETGDGAVEDGVGPRIVRLETALRAAGLAA